MHPLASEILEMQTILVGTEGHADDEQALAMLCAMLNPSCVRLRIVHVIVVPSNVPLGISMPVPEKEAARILEQAQRIADRFHIETQTAILQGRTVGECLVEEAGRGMASAICIRFRSRPVPWGHRLVSETISTLLSTASCSVIMLHPPHRRHGI